MKDGTGRPTHIRYWILFLLFAVSTISYADRSVLSIAGKAVQDSLHITKVDLGWIFSAFGWSYAFAQIPGGFILDRFGAKLTYAAALVLWSLFTFFHGLAGFLAGGAAVTFLFAMRFLVGLFSAPGVPANARIVANWFPTSERGTASAIFNAAQYFAPFAFNWMLAYVVLKFDWPSSFYFMGAIGLGAAIVLMLFLHGPTRHPLINRAEFEEIEKNGALVHIEDKGAPSSAAFTWNNVKQVLFNRMLLGIYLGQYCINVLTYFFITWFPLYLVEERHMTLLKAAQWSGQAALVGFAGGVLGGIVSDWLLRLTGSVTFARKAPLLVGMLLATLIIGCNYTDSEAMMLVFMCCAFFGKGFAALGWAVVSDTTPKQLVGVTGGIFNMAGNLAAIVTPVVFGYIIQNTHSYSLGLVFVGAHCIATILCYFLITRKIERLELKPAR